jgi:ADP-heptose:LPS heptosyltransferase
MELQQARNVLVCLRWGIGDLVMELPLLEALRRYVPDARLTGLGAAPAVELLEGGGAVDQLQAVQQFGFTHWGDTGSDNSRYELLRWLRQSCFDYVLDTKHAAQGVQMALWQAGLSGADTGDFDRIGRTGRQRDGSARLAAAAAATWGVEIGGSGRPRLQLHEHERRAAAELTHRLSPDATLVGVAPIASSPLKRGAASQFARVADALAVAGARVAVFAGDQPDVAEATLSAMHARRDAWLVPSMHLRSTAALLAQCRVLVCNDTGLMHLAAAVDTPVVAVFACTSPHLYLPRNGAAVARWRQPCSYLLHDDFGASPCVARGLCLDPRHQSEQAEAWADAAIAAAGEHLSGGVARALQPWSREPNSGGGRP